MQWSVEKMDLCGVDCCYGQVAWQDLGYIRPSIGFRSPVDWRSSRMAGGSLLPQPDQVCSCRSILFSCEALNYVASLVPRDVWAVLGGKRVACYGCAACTTSEDHSPRQAVASLQDTLFLSLLVKTHMS